MIRPATMNDVKRIQAVVNQFAREGEMLSLSLSEIYERLFEFVVWEEGGVVIGCCALHPSWEGLAEIRSLAVSPDTQKSGVGRELVTHLLERARQYAVTNVFALTYVPVFFQKLGFHEVVKDDLPKKIWTDCLKCAKFPDCDEIAMMREL